MYYKLDSEGHQNLFMSEIVYHQRNVIAFTKNNGSTGKQSNITKKTTKVQEVLIEWKYDTTTWVNIKDV